MKQSSNIDEQQHSTSPSSAGVLNADAAIIQFLTANQIEPRWAAEFNKAAEIYLFQLGDDLFTYNPPDLPAQSCSSTTNDYFYFVCEGRVRLLAFDATLQRDVSALVLETGDGFAGDELWFNQPCHYQAIAASGGILAKIERHKLERIFQKLPQLLNQLQEKTQHRQKHIFFKTCTDLRSLKSYQIEQILPHLNQISVSAGTQLTKATSLQEGRFWLYTGQIDTGNGNQPVTPGIAWGYPEQTPISWVAQTDLVVYHLPAEEWEKASSAKKPSKRPVSTTPLTVAIPQSDVTKDKTNQSQKAKPSTSDNISFPKPAHRRLLDVFARYPFIEQQSSSDCGAACLAMIAQYWGKRFTINYLRELAGVGRAGASLTKGLPKAAETIGFHARPVRADLRSLEGRHPWIAHWQGDHYIVVYQVQKYRVLIADPALGKRYLKRQEFINNWSGYALLLEPTQRLQNSENQKISLNQFFAALTPYRNLIGQIIFASILIQVFGLITPLFTQVILDRVVINKSLTTLNVFAVGLVLFGIWGIILALTRQYLLDYFSNRFDLTLIGGFISHTLSLPLKFFESRRVGDIITRVQENQKIQQFLTRQVVLAWLEMLTGIVYLVLMLYYNTQLTLLVLAFIPPIVLLTLIATPILRRLSREIFNESANQNSLLVEMLTGVATVKGAAAEREIRWRWEDKFTSALNVGFRGQKFGYLLQGISGSINTLSGTALLWYGATLVIQDQLTIGQFVAFNMMIGKVISPIMGVVGLWNQIQEVFISVERLNDVFEAEPEEVPGSLMLPQLRGEVQFVNVTFAHDKDVGRNTLENISFLASPGQTIAVVGRSGSGKTTLVNLLQALYHPDGGRILIDGYDIHHVSLQSLRQQIGVVPQECFLFSGTILENITLYRDEFSLEQVTEAAKLAEAHAFIQDLPLGYNTKVGERGSTLSGGQRQRIAIARALLGTPRILVLDEATSSLDTESERRFQTNLERLSRDRTTFIIAHRLSTVRNADCILVLDRGVLLETGTHEQLMAKRGLYYHLAEQQLDL